MTKQQFEPCPICGEEPDVSPGWSMKELTIGYDHWNTRKCPFLKDYDIDRLNEGRCSKWNRCVYSYEEFHDLYAGQECPVCDKTITVTAGYDQKTFTLQVAIACGCTEATAGDVSHAVNLWLDRHESAARKRIDANERAGRIAKAMPDVTVDQSRIGDPIDWTVRCELRAWNKRADLDAFLSDAGVKVETTNGGHYCTQTIREYDARRARVEAYGSPIYQAAKKNGLALVVVGVTRA